jgi:uncharacterized protein with PQ loop repeat
MELHAFHKEHCPEAKGSAGPLLAALTTLTAIVAPLNAVPQIIKIFETKSIGSVSIITYLIVIVTQVIWLIYGVKLSLRPLVISSVVVLFLSAIIVIQFVVYS